MNTKNKIFLKKFICILLTSLFLIFAVACTSMPHDSDNDENHSTAQQLNPPKVFYENGTISWDAVENADKYEVSINNKIFVTYDCFYQLPITKNILFYTVKVKSISESKMDSVFSTPLTFSARLLPEVTNLSMAFNHNADEYILSWNQSDCEKYTIFINENKFVTEKNNLTTHSSDYITGENVVSVLPLGNTYDVIPKATILYVEKSLPFSDVSNIHIENGNLVFGKNQIYQGYIPEGKTNDFCLSNIEDGKIKSDGPKFAIERVQSPQMDSYVYGYLSMNSDTIISVTLEIITSVNCDNVYIELVQRDKVILNSKDHGTIIRGGDGSSYQYWLITIDTKGYYIPQNTYAYVTAYETNCIKSPTIRYHLV